LNADSPLLENIQADEGWCSYAAASKADCQVFRLNILITAPIQREELLIRAKTCNPWRLMSQLSAHPTA
jgi:hypothetical protein